MPAATMSIGELSRRTGVASSAIRYYEQRRLLPRAERRSGRRLFDEASVARLAAIRFAKDAGFTLAEIEELVLRFGEARWRALALRKLRQIDESAARLRLAREMLRGVVACGCFDLEECGKRLLVARRSRDVRARSRGTA